MTSLTILSEAELDAVCGGTTVTVTGTGGAGGTGGNAVNGAAVGGWSSVYNSDLSVNCSRATANGGDGGAGILVAVRVGGR
jgi:hypothetical protein